jgi:hypothetical protein
MKLVSLPSGKIINLEHVAAIVPFGAVLQVCFSATYATDRTNEPMMLKLPTDDAKALLGKLEDLDVDTKPTFAALKPK